MTSLLTSIYEPQTFPLLLVVQYLGRSLWLGFGLRRAEQCSAISGELRKAICQAPNLWRISEKVTSESRCSVLCMYCKNLYSVLSEVRQEEGQ